MNGVGVYTLKHSTAAMFKFMKRFIPFLAVCLLPVGAMSDPAAQNPRYSAAVVITGGPAVTIVLNPPALQFRLVMDEATADSEPMTNLGAGLNPLKQPEVLNIQKTVLLDQTSVKRATALWHNQVPPQIDIQLTDDGAKRLAAVTRENIGKRLAIIIDGKLCLAPRIASEISGGQVVISGVFTKQQALNFAARLNGSPVGEGRAGNKNVFGAIGVLIVVALGSATWFAIRRGRAPGAT